jgi:CRISPR system Cascade subunit CasA
VATGFGKIIAGLLLPSEKTDVKNMVNLIQEEWIPVIRKDGSRIPIAPWQVTDDHEKNPIQRLNASRADFNGALIQFLIGLVQTALPPSSDREWFRRFESPPQPAELRERFAAYSHAFEMDGDGPRFMQDFGLPEMTKTFEISQLLIEMPGENTVEDNIDHFIKRGTVQQICQHCCAMALYTLQTNAPGGGRGHRTSLRGGGPLTTIVMGRTLWETVWLNVLPSGALAKYGNANLQGDADIFPWLGPTRASDKNDNSEPTTPLDAHPAQMFWGMPRRIRIDRDENAEGVCDLCGCSRTHLVRRYQTKTYRVHYKGNWRHTLTPYSKSEKDEFIPKKGQPDGITYRNWLGLVQNDPNSQSEPAAVVHAFRYDRQPDLPEVPFRLWAFGYDMDKGKPMKARCWYEGTMPLIKVDPSIRADYEAVTAQLIKTASLVADDTRDAIWSAMYEPKVTKDQTNPQTAEKFRRNHKKKVLEKSIFLTSRARFWKDTEAEFYTVLQLLKDATEKGEDTVELKLRWLRTVRKEAESQFDEYSQLALIGVADPRRIATARRELRNFTSPTTKKIRETLDLPKPPSGKKSTKTPA